MEVELVKSRTQSWVPLVGGMLLHSIVDPEKEAEAFITSEWPSLIDARSVIIFGLGGGFHIQELLRRKDLNVVVIEASRELASQIEEKKPDLVAQVTLLAGQSTDLVFKDPAVIKCFSGPFSILKHPASYRVLSFYYSSILKELNRRTVNRLKKMAEGNERLVRFLSSLDINGDQILTLPMIEEAMSRRGTGLEREGLIWMAMRELII